MKTRPNATSPSNILKQLTEKAKLIEKAPDSPNFAQNMQAQAAHSDEQKQGEAVPKAAEKREPTRQEKQSNRLMDSSVANFSKFYSQNCGANEPQLWKKAVKQAVKEQGKEKDKSRAKDRENKSSRYGHSY